jgi:hypothetical protein
MKPTCSFLLLLTVRCCGQSAAAAPPNFVRVNIDDLGYADLENRMIRR